jgi:beta-glucanase (GH16 family)
MEHVGYDPNVVHGTLHTERFYSTNGRGHSTDSLIDNGTLASIDVLNEFHTYGIIWNNTSIEWFFDGYSLGSVSYEPTKNQTYLLPTSVDWPFDQNFYIILNLAIGGNWGGAQGIDNTIFPATFVIDYVRVYQQDYISDDVENPSMPTRPQVLSIVDRTAYLTWTPSTDDNAIRRYNVFVNGNFKGFTSVNGIQLTALPSGQDNFIMFIAEDYAGNFSNAMETVITIG